MKDLSGSLNAGRACMLVLGLRGKRVVRARSHIRMMNPGLGSPSRGWVGRANYIGKEGSDLMAWEEEDQEEANSCMWRLGV